jgi:hypothetical protein
MNGARAAALRAAPRLALVAVMPLLAPLGGCVSGSFSHRSIDEPIAGERLAALQPGATTLGDALERLGAPNRVYEYRLAADGTAGMALLWFWRDAAGWGLSFSVGRDDVPGSVSIDRLSADLPACMLWFGPDLVLERWRKGTVGDLAPARRRATPPADG